MSRVSFLYAKETLLNIRKYAAMAMEDQGIDEIYLYDSSNYFSDGEVVNIINGFKVVKEGIRYLIRDDIAQNVFKNPNAYVQVSDCHSLHTDVIGVYVKIEDVQNLWDSLFDKDKSAKADRELKDCLTKFRALMDSIRK